MTLGQLRALDGAEVDLSDVPSRVEELDAVSQEIGLDIRRDQEERIRSHRDKRNVEDADALLCALGTLSPQAVEDRIAQLRDGRSAAIFQSVAGQLITAFTPEFVTAAAGPGWPKRLADYRIALSGDGPLHTEEDRRTAAAELIGTYLELTASVGEGGPSLQRIRGLLELVGFDRVQIGQTERVTGARAWKYRIAAHIAPDGWFLPPAFGSKAAGYDLVLAGPDVLPEQIQGALDGKTGAIVVLSGVADLARRREFAERLRASAIPVLLVDEALIAFAATRRDTRRRTIFECGLPYGRVEPYTTDAGQIPPEMFFGRRAEIAQIMSRTADGCLVYGGRQLGKSALLNHVAKVHHARAEDRIVLRREVKPLGNAEATSAIWSHLAAMLAPFAVVRERSRSADDVIADIRKWLVTRPRGQIVCLFDETDHFMAAETRADYPELSRLKALMEDTERAFKVVFAGLHNVQRTFVQPNSPLAHLGTPICIGPLNRTQDDKRAAHDLVVEPMHAAGFRFEGDDDVDEILAWANYYPSLIQEYSKGLLSTLHGVGSGKPYRLRGDGPLWTIPSIELFDHVGFGQIEARVRDKFHLTLELDPRYALVAHTLAWLNADGDEHGALVVGFRPEELLKQAQTFWPKNAEIPSRQAFEALLQEMFDLGVLGRVRIENSERFRYCLASRQVAAMLGSKDDVLRTLEHLEEKDPSVAYDRTVHRRTYASRPGREPLPDGPYAPLTDQQIEELIGSDGPFVRIVCGLDILGLDKIGTALRRMADAPVLPGARRWSQVMVEIATTATQLGDLVTQAPAGTQALRVVIYRPDNAQEAERALNWLGQRDKVLDGLVRPVLLLDAADAALREIATRRFDEAVWLIAWGSEMLRIHLHNIEKEGTDLDTPSRRAAILQATGGIPTETTNLVRALVNAEEPDGVIAGWKAGLHNIAEIASGPVGRSLVIIEEAKKRDDYVAIDELLRETVGTDLVTIGPDLVAMGLISRWNSKTYSIRRC